MGKYRTKIRCGKCNQVIPLKDGKRIIDGKKVICPNGHTNVFKQKKGNGGFKVVLK